MDIYKIGVTIALTNEMSKVIAVIAQDLLGLTKRIGEVEAAWKRIGALNVVGTLAIGAAVAETVELIESTKDLSHELVQLQKTGMSPELFANIRQQAKDIPLHVRGVTQEDVIRAGAATYSMFGEEIGKPGVLEEIVKFEQTLSNTMGTFKLSNEELVKAVRAAEMSGRITDPDTKQVSTGRMKEYLDLIQRMVQMTHGIVSPSTVLQLAQQGGPALMQLDNKGLETLLMLSQMMGGARAGTAMMSLYQQMAGGVMYKRTAEELEKLGLLKPEEWGMSGGHVKLTAEASKRLSEQMGKDPLEWAKNVILPALAAHNITSPEDINIELFKFIQRQTTERALADIIRNQKQLEAERGRIDLAPGIDKSIALQDEDVEQAIANVSASWHNLKLTVAGDGPEIAKGLNLIADAIDLMTVGLRKYLTFQETVEAPFRKLLEGKSWSEALSNTLISGLGSAMKSVIDAVPGIFAGFGKAIIDAIKKSLPTVPAPTDEYGRTLPQSYRGAPIMAPPRIINASYTGPSSTGPTIPGGASASRAPEIPDYDAPPSKKVAYDAVPPAGSGTGGGFAAVGDVYLDGVKITEIVMGHAARMAGGPTEGAPYLDNTNAAPPMDSVHALA